MQSVDVEHSFKVVVVGNGNVGKSSLIRRFCKNQYVQNYKKTIGVEYQVSIIMFEDDSLGKRARTQGRATESHG